MKIKMLSSQRGTLNNGAGNISMDYLSGQVYDACPEEAAYWIECGYAEAFIEAPVRTEPPQNKAIMKYENKAIDLDSLTPKKAYKRKHK